MANPLFNLYGNRLPTAPLSFQNSDSTPPFWPSAAPAVPTQTQTLPNGGGTFNAAGGSKITPSPVVAPAATDLYAKYRDPKTGNIMSPEEYAIYLGNKVPKGAGDIPTYAGDAMTNPSESAAGLTTRATNLNNARNDIATGTTDPYKAGVQSGIGYSGAELAAIEKAYAGVYDPALNDVFARLKAKQAEDAKVADREAQIFATNENIRQWKATTGSKSSSGGSGSSTVNEKLTPTQMRQAARNAGVDISVMESMDPNLANFFYAPPKGRRDDDTVAPIDDIFNEDFQRVIDGELSADEMADNINSSTLPAEVKHYFIDQIPAEPAKKEGWFSSIWNSLW